MTTSRRDEALASLGSLFGLGKVGDRTDGQLLERFLDGKGPAAQQAFAALVDRHGPLVLGTCRAVLRSDHDARDAGQAVFFVLARKAGSLWVEDSLGPWLHRVACRVARAALADRARRAALERRAAAMLATDHDAAPDRGDGEAVAALHEEIDRLPERFRAPILLCDLEGRTHEQAARHLGCPVGTIKSRLSRGRRALRARLIRRGLAPSLAAGIAAVAPSARAEFAVTTALHAAAATARGLTTTAAGITPAALALAEGALHAMLITKLKLTAATIVVSLAAIGAAVLAQPQEGPRPTRGPEASAPPAQAPAAGRLTDAERLDVLERQLGRVLDILERQSLDRGPIIPEGPPSATDRSRPLSRPLPTVANGPFRQLLRRDQEAIWDRLLRDRLIGRLDNEDASPRDWLMALFRAYLGRDPENTEMAHLMAPFGHGAEQVRLAPEAMARHLIRSDEFVRLGLAEAIRDRMSPPDLPKGFRTHGGLGP